MKISNAGVKIILDSRGKETLEVELKSGDFSAIASVPNGKSTGAYEMFVLEPVKVLEKFEEIKQQILSCAFESQEEFDRFLINLDGTQNKNNLGSNLILSLSLAFARLKAKSEGKELYEYIRHLQSVIYNLKFNNFLKPIFNVINGGAHAGYQHKSTLNQRKSASIEFQEFQVIPEVSDFNMALSIGKIFYRKLGDYLRQKFGGANVVLGDEAGYSAPFKNNEEALEAMAEVIAKYKYPLKIGLDVAATQFYQRAELCGIDKEQHENSSYYLIGGKKYTVKELREYYLKLIDAYNIISIEDPFYEEDFDVFALFTADLYKLGLININKNASMNQFNRYKSVLVIADDLTTTNPKRLKIAIEKKSGNAILIKLNQIGTLTETLEVVKMAYENNWQAVVSHRSGETTDDFIADLAVGVGAWGIKAGAPAKPERLAKYNRILEIISQKNFTE